MNAFSPPNSMHPTHAPAQAGASSRNFAGKFSARDDVISYRAHFALTWQRFIRENFESPTHAAFTFKVDATTADKWWNGLNAPSGWVVAMTVANPEYRESALALLGGQQ